jgi:acyl-CoA thioester hydrolase
MQTLQTFRVERRVEFADTDLAGMVHFSSFFRYMEETEYAFLRSLGLGSVMPDPKGIMGMPRHRAKCTYHNPARFEDLLTTELRVVLNDGLRLRYEFCIQRGDELIAEGEIQVVCCRFPDDRNPYAIPFPKNVIDRIPRISN